MKIGKSTGFTPSEKMLAELCDTTFLKLWSYSNPFKADGKELCDLIAVFEDHVFLFFDRDSRKFEDLDGDINVQWRRWQKEVIEKQIKTSEGARRYIQQSPDKVFLDSKGTIPFPIPIPREGAKIHNIIVAHGAAEACKRFSPNNIYGSLAIVYDHKQKYDRDYPFLIKLNSDEPLHVFDTCNLSILLNELDTVYDFSAYLTAKEDAIRKYDTLLYCGEEDLLAHYFLNFDPVNQQYFIGVQDERTNGVMIGEGEWLGFIKSIDYQRRKDANKVSKFWDDLLQRTSQNALNGDLKGHGNVFLGQSAIYEMAKEPRFSRRALSEFMKRAIENFPGDGTKFMRNLSIMPSFYKDRTYVFLQLHNPDIKDYENEYRPRRQKLLEIACGVTKNKFPHFKKILGIAIDAPKFNLSNSEDFLLLDGEGWTEEDRKYYNTLNKEIKFLETDQLKKGVVNIKDFPTSGNFFKSPKVGRNDPCPCGSGKKYKKCCIEN